eukprot:3576967-Pyramimonas_sp.AAC.1
MRCSTAEASPQETPHRKPNTETPGRPLIFGAGTSRFALKSNRNRRNPGHPGGKQDDRMTLGLGPHCN